MTSTIEKIIREVCTYAGDAKADDRVRTALDSARSAAAGQPTYGVSHIADALSEPVAKALGRLLGITQANSTRFSQDRTYAILHGVGLWLGPDGRAYASCPVRGHTEHYEVRSRAFRRWALVEAARGRGRPPPQTIIDQIVEFAEARAQLAGEVHQPRIRVAATNGKFYVDLCDEKWGAIEIDAEGWRLVEAPPVKFVRGPGMCALPVPEENGTLEKLRPLVNVIDEEDFYLFVAALFAALVPDKPYPVLILTGEQGTSKTTLARLFKLLIDPHEIDARSLPNNERELFISAENTHVLTFDNVSHVHPWLADALCRLSTGGAYVTRELFTNREETLIKAKRPVVLNGIPFTVDRPDLLDRSIILTLPVIAAEHRMDEDVYWGRVHQVRGSLLGLLLTALSTALRRLPEVSLKRRPRMADLAKWLSAAEPSFQLEQGTLLRIMEERRARSLRELADDVLVATLQNLLEEQSGQLEMTASELLASLNDRVERFDRPRNWPRGANYLAGRMRHLAPALRELGIDVELGNRRASDNNRLICLRLREGVIDSSPI